MNKPYRKRHKRRFWLFIPITALFLAVLWWENHALEVTHTTISLASLPTGFDGVEIAVLADLQGMAFGQSHQTLLDTVKEQDPDYIFLVGDVVDKRRDVEETYVPTLAAGLSAIAPTYFVTGNHEWAVGDVDALKETLMENGVTVLTNELLSLESQGDTLILAGIDDPNGYADQKTPEELAAEVIAQNPACWLLLAHRNDYFPMEYCYLGADVVFSGHGHGGLVRLPFTDGLIDHQGFFPSYTAGLYEEEGSLLFVTRGLGNSSVLPRLFNRPEVAMVTLVGE